jgi:4-amino-4-deoxy-L-arabinose transferase-like glycosyltransferase
MKPSGNAKELQVMKSNHGKPSGFQNFLSTVPHIPWLEFSLIVGLAFIIRLLSNAWIFGFNYLPDPDTKVYETIALNLINGLGFTCTEGKSYVAPLYPLFIAGVYSIFGIHNYIALKILESLIGGFTCGFVYLIGVFLFGPFTGRLAGIIAMFYPLLIHATSPALTENLFTSLLAVGTTFLAKLIGKFRWRYALGAGLFLGLATLTRPITLLLPFVLIVWSFLVIKKIPHAWYITGTVSLTIAIVILPWLIRNYSIHHQFLFATEDGVTFWGSNNPVVAENPEKAGRWILYTDLPHAEELSRLPELAQRHRAQELGWQFIRENPDKILRLEIEKLSRFWSLYPNRSKFEKVVSLLSYGILFPFMLTGAIWSFFRNRSGSALLLGIISPFVVSTLVYYGSTRMRLPIEPYLIIFAAFTLVRLGSFGMSLISSNTHLSIFQHNSESGTAS